MELWPNPAFQPKVISSSFRSRVIRVRPFFPPPHVSTEDERRHRLCPVRMIRHYLSRSASLGGRTSCLSVSVLGTEVSLYLLNVWHIGCVWPFVGRMRRKDFPLRRWSGRTPLGASLRPPRCSVGCPSRTFVWLLRGLRHRRLRGPTFWMSCPKRWAGWSWVVNRCNRSLHHCFRRPQMYPNRC